MPEWVVLVTALLATLSVSWPVLLLLRDRGVVDVPNARSSHARVTPRGGGLAVVAGIGVGLWAGDVPLAGWGIYAGAVAAAVVGFIDDVRGLSAGLRLVLQGLLALLVALGLLRAAGLDVPTGLAAVLATTVWLAGYVNAFNFMDGINGISGVSAAAAGGWFLLLGEAEGLRSLALGGAALLGGALGFLPWNVPVARMFLGDVGSYGLGILIGSLAVLGVVAGIHPVLVVAPLLLYVADTGWTLVQRLRRGEPWREAHRQHVYQRLCEGGRSHVQVSAFVLLVTLALCAAAWWLPVAAAGVVCLALLAAYLATPRVAHPLVT